MNKIQFNLETAEKYLVENEWEFETRTIDEYHVILTGLNAENIAFKFQLLFKEADILYISNLPSIKVEHEKVNDLLHLLNQINSRIRCGKFYYMESANSIFYEHMTSTEGHDISTETIEDLILSCSITIDNNIKTISSVLVDKQ